MKVPTGTTVDTIPTGGMSYGAPWERGVGAADTMPLRGMEVPGLIPDVGEVELTPKEARRGRQRDRRQRRRKAAVQIVVLKVFIIKQQDQQLALKDKLLLKLEKKVKKLICIKVSLTQHF